jgi:hypothetical protein
MKKKFAKIKSSNSLIRDLKNRAVINTNKSEYHRHLEQKAKRIQDAKDLINLKNDVEILKQTVQKLLEKNKE